MATLYLGSCDADKLPSDRIDYLKPYHRDGLLVNKVSFRDDDRTKWRSFRKVPGGNVTRLQQFLHHAGFMPRGGIDGVFDYVTQAAVRLFQEYVRTVEQIPDMKPDGIVGRGTLQHINRWQQENRISDWAVYSGSQPMQAYENWMQLLEKAKQHYIAHPGPTLQRVNQRARTGATRKPADWSFNRDDVHLIGVRRNQTQRTNRRSNDDLFFLLINGMVFTFWGSTDSSANSISRSDEAFLVEGQHLYRYGWHKITNERKIYRALKPHRPEGVLVARDWDGDNALTNNDLLMTDSQGRRRQLEINNSINIHWSGIGTSNFSAGCQVIAGKSYINHQDALQDCSSFASVSYGSLTDTGRKTKGAYNVLADLMVCYAKPNVHHICYTLGREASFDLDANFGRAYSEHLIARLKSV